MTSPHIGYDGAAVVSAVAGMRTIAAELPQCIAAPAEGIAAAAAKPLAEGVGRSPLMAAFATTMTATTTAVGETAAAVTDSAATLDRWRRREDAIQQNGAAEVQGASG